MKVAQDTFISSTYWTDRVGPAAALATIKKMKDKDKEMIEYPGMYHSLSIDLGREKVFEDILDWILRRI